MHATQGRGGRAGGMRAPCATVVLYARVPEADGWERASYETPRRLWPALARPIPLWATFRLPMTSLNPRLPDQRRARSQKGNLIGRWGGGPRPPPSGSALARSHNQASQSTLLATACSQLATSVGSQLLACVALPTDAVSDAGVRGTLLHRQRRPAPLSPYRCASEHGEVYCAPVGAA